MPPFMMAVTRYIWFIGAAMGLFHAIRVRQRLASQVALGTITAADAHRVARTFMFVATFPFVGLGLVSLWAGYDVPFCRSMLTPHTAPEIVTALIIVGVWAATLAWIWTADDTSRLSAMRVLMKDHPFSPTDPTRPNRIQLTLFLVLSAGGFLFFQNVITQQPDPRAPFQCPAMTATK
jgi:hypothetical protein